MKRRLHRLHPFISATALWSFCISAPVVQADPAQLLGIHWYSSDPASTDVETLSGNRPCWVMDQALLNTSATVAAGNPWETPWQTSPTVDKTVPFYKPGYTSAITAKGHAMIMRLQPQWAANIPHSSDLYQTANFADDCRAAANLMKNVHTWQIGNETNLVGEMNRWDSAANSYSIPWTSADRATAPEQYAEMYVACRDKIHEVTPQTSPAGQVVLMQPNSPGGKNADRYMSSDEFLARMINAVPDKSKIDGFALHAYADPATANFGADGFMNQLRLQLAIIDEFGLGNRPIYITEYNRHMPNPAEANAAALFIGAAGSSMNAWNNYNQPTWPATGPGAGVIAGVNHSLAAAAWFVYRYDGGWQDYALQYWKSQIPSTDPSVNPWYSYQAAIAQNYPSGSGPGPVLDAVGKWFTDDFVAPTIDAAWPLPRWTVEAGAGTTIEPGTGGVALKGTGGFGLAGLYAVDVPMVNCLLETDFTLTNATPVQAGECNFEVRFGQEGSGGPGYSLTFFPTSSGASAGTVALRRTSTWETYRSQQIAGGINSGDQFRVRIWARADRVEVQVVRMADASMVLDWTGPNGVPAPEFRAGGIGMWSYNLRQANLEAFSAGGLDSGPAAGAAGWELY